MIVVMFLVVTIVFIIVRVTPGDPAAVMLGPDATAQDIADLRSRLGLDQSLIVQYTYYVGQLLKGDLGQSIFLNMPVTSALMDRAEPTFFLTIFSLLIASVIALPIGIYAAYRPGRIVDQDATTLAMQADSKPRY
jgi:peptide/nickel transport system permease protein